MRKREPKQLTLLTEDKPMSLTPSPRNTHEDANRESAALILRDLARYGGEESLMGQWARRVNR